MTKYNLCEVLTFSIKYYTHAEYFYNRNNWAQGYLTPHLSTAKRVAGVAAWVSKCTLNAYSYMMFYIEPGEMICKGMLYMLPFSINTGGPAISVDLGPTDFTIHLQKRDPPGPSKGDL